ncbi:hypothetical protein NQ317_006769 [Molorchus minor]|uniref:Uncharacterized protein n=1 Tax=Molorchus minor TaxID=1323400 RepID=A0ABQ9JN41_9CUCU|nr:hypothetical protein NQ317_006769 [Molorchus minor]
MDKERGKRKRNANFAAHEVVCSHIMYIIYKFFVIVKKIVQLFNIHHYNHYYNKRKETDLFFAQIIYIKPQSLQIKD